jgi:hypothetical protein
MRVLVAILFASAAVAACAADPTPTPADSIQAAKKDFSAIKSSGVPATDSGAGMPSLELKEIGPIPGGALAPTPLPPESDGLPALDPSKKKPGNGNWLVDAMENGGDASGSPRAGDDALKGGTDLTRGVDRLDPRRDKDAPPSRDSGEKGGAKETELRAYNPLDSFMAGWISARDHDLLIPTARADTLSGGDLSRAAVDALPGLATGPSVAVTDSALPSPDQASWSEPKQAGNPYLALDDAPVPAMKVFAVPPELPDFAPDGDPYVLRGSVPSAADPAPTDSTRSFIPDFAQPTDDDIYFRQMKRF